MDLFFAVEITVFTQATPNFGCDILDIILKSVKCGGMR